MRGFGRYSALHEAHARAAAQKTAAGKEIKDAGRQVTDRRGERRDRDQSQTTAQRPMAEPSIVDHFNLRPSRPMMVDAWSHQLPSGPAPGESERGFIRRRQVSERQIRENRQVGAREAKAKSQAEPSTASSPRNKAIQDILDRRAAKTLKAATGELEKDRWLGAQINDD